MRIAYIVLAHRLAQQLARLVRRLADGESAFFIHLDRSADRRNGYDLQRAVVEALAGLSNVAFLRRHRCYWGNFQIVEATLEGIGEIVRSGRQFDRVVLLSGQDYPIKPLSQIKAYFAHHREAEFIEAFLLTAPNRWTEHAGAYNAVARVKRWHLHYRSRTLTLPWERRFLRGISPYGGSQWWALSMECIAHIWEYVQRERGFLAYFRHTFIPDELFFHTIVANSTFADRICGHDLTFADWSQPAPPYPATLDAGYLPSLRASQKLFARKFDSGRDPELLDLIDDQLLQEDRLARGMGSTAARAACRSEAAVLSRPFRP